MNLRSRCADLKVWLLNKLHYIFTWTRHFVKDLTHDLKLDGNGDLRLFVFVFAYLAFSVIGAYNFAHLLAFIYIIWLLEKHYGN